MTRVDILSAHFRYTYHQYRATCLSGAASPPYIRSFESDRLMFCFAEIVSFRCISYPLSLSRFAFIPKKPASCSSLLGIARAHPSSKGLSLRSDPLVLPYAAPVLPVQYPTVS